jgi:hypothetical protein
LSGWKRSPVKIVAVRDVITTFFRMVKFGVQRVFRSEREGFYCGSFSMNSVSPRPDVNSNWLPDGKHWNVLADGKTTPGRRLIRAAGCRLFRGTNLTG